MNIYQSYTSKYKSEREKQIEVVYSRVLKIWGLIGVLIVIVSIIN